MQWFEVLLRLARTPGGRLRMSDLAAQTTLTASGLTRVVDRLEDAGLVKREACPTDRRSTYAVLTAEGPRPHRDRRARAPRAHRASSSAGVLDAAEMAALAVGAAQAPRRAQPGGRGVLALPRVS